MFCAALALLETPLLMSVAVARQKIVVLVGRSLVGVNDVSLTPSAFVPPAMIGLNDADVDTSNRYVMTPAGPLRVAFVTRNVGRGPAVVPLSGLIATGAL